MLQLLIKFYYIKEKNRIDTKSGIKTFITINSRIKIVYNQLTNPQWFVDECVTILDTFFFIFLELHSIYSYVIKFSPISINIL